jgi:hypothetical protein
MVTATERIGALWLSGEEHSVDGEPLTALLHFLRAKTLLLNESKSIFAGAGGSSSASSSRASKILGELMQKLTASIDRDVANCNKNPIHTLGLSVGFTKADVKKAYRKSALKFHPDKNQDCDTSCIFSAIQTAYEKLKLSSEISASLGVAASAPPAAGAGYHQGGGGGVYSSTSRNRASDGTSSSSTFSSQQQHKHQQQHKQQQHGSSLPGLGKPSRPNVQQQQGILLSEISTDAMRRVLKEFGVSE